CARSYYDGYYFYYAMDYW
nr:immunoglobulin heavy chain junction region [Mus musculus]